MEVPAQEVEALGAFPEVDATGLVRVEFQPEIRHDRRGSATGILGLGSGRAQDHVAGRPNWDLLATVEPR